jgi:hypothetical protein
MAEEISHAYFSTDSLKKFGCAATRSESVSPLMHHRVRVSTSARLLLKSPGEKYQLREFTAATSRGSGGFELSNWVLEYPTQTTSSSTINRASLLTASISGWIGYHIGFKFHLKPNAQDQRQAIALYLGGGDLAPRPLDLEHWPSSECVDRTQRDYPSRTRSSHCRFLQQLKL